MNVVFETLGCVSLMSCWIPKDEFDNYFEKKFIYLFKNMTYFDIND